MDRATPEEAEKVVQGRIEKVIEHHDEFLNSNKFPTVEVDGEKIPDASGISREN